MLRVADLFADFSLRSTKFSEGMRDALDSAKRAGKDIEKALGDGPTKALKETAAEAKKTGDIIEDAIGKRPKKVVGETEKEAARATWVVRGYIKDTSKVITGILISQAFYSLLRTIRESTQAVWEFRGELEQAAIQFNYLLGDTRASAAMLKELKIFAAETPFDLQESIQSARLLLAAGFSIGEVMPVMRGMTDVAAATGNEYARIADIFGQIRSEGRLTAMTMRRLQKMAIPVTHILQEELGLTADEIVRIGKLAIPADVAIGALLKGWEKRFAGAAQDLQGTLLGMMNAIKDYLLFVGSAIIDSFFTSWKGTMTKFQDVLEDLYEGIERMGIAYLLERFIPKELHQSIRIIIGALSSLWNSLKLVWQAIKPVLSAMGDWLVRALSMALPLLAGLTRILSQIFAWATSNSVVIRILVGTITGLTIAAIVATNVALLAQAIKLLGISSAVGAAVGFLTASIQALWVALLKNPIIAGVMILAAALIGLAMSTKSVSEWLDRVIKQLMQLFGFDIDMILKPTNPEDLTDVLKEIGDQFEDLVDDAEEAGQAIKDTFIASFDEVYPIPDKLAGAGDALKKFPDFSDWWKDKEGDDIDENLVPSKGLLQEAKKEWEGFFAIPWEPPNINWGPLIPPTAVVTAWESLVRVWDNLKIRVGDCVDEVARAIREGVTTTIPQALAEGWGRLTEGIRSRVDEIRRLILEGLIITLPAVAVSIATAVADALSRGWKSIETWLHDILEPVETWGTELATLVGVGLATALAAIKKFPADCAKSFNDWVTNTKTNVSNWGRELGLGVSLAISTVVAVITSLPGKAWEGLKRGFDELVERFKEWGSRLGKVMEDNKGVLIGIAVAAAIGLVLAFLGVPAGVGAAIAGVVAIVGGIFEDTKVEAATKIEETKKDITNRWTDIKERIEEIWEGLKLSAGNKWKAIKETIKGLINDIIDLINRLIRYWNSLRFEVPSMDLGPLGKVGGQTIGLPRIGEIPRLQRGGIVPEEMLIHAHGHEAIVPLTGEEARPFARAIAREIAAIMPNQSRTSGYTPTAPIYVGTLIADDRGLKELERKLYSIRVLERGRRGE